MTGPLIVLALLLALAAGVGGLCAVARYAPEIRAVILRLVAIGFTPMQMAGDWCRQSHAAVKAWLKGQVAAMSPDPEHALSNVLGALFYTGCGALLVVSEIPLAALTLEAFGFATLSEKLAQLEFIDAGICMGTSLVLSPVVWGVLVFDLLGITRFAPFLEQSRFRKILLAICISGAVASVTVLGLLACYRGSVITDLLVAEAGAEELGSPVGEGMPAPDLSQGFEELASADDPLELSLSMSEEVDTALDLPAVSPFAARIPLLVFTTSAAGMAVLAFFSLAAGMPVFIWAAAGFLSCGLLVLWLGRVVFDGARIVCNALAEFFLSLLEAGAAVGSDLLRLFRVPSREGAAGVTSREDTDADDAHPGAQETAAEEVESGTGFPHGRSGFDPFGLAEK